MTPAVSAVLAPYFQFMRRYHMFPKMTHVPGHLNIIADSLSRFKQPLPEPLTVTDHCVVRWQELLVSSPVCIAQTGRKWPSKFGVDIKKCCSSPQTVGSLNRFLLGSFRLRLVDFRFGFGACSNSPPGSTSLLPRFWVCISVLLLCVGGLQFDQVTGGSVRVRTRWCPFGVQPLCDQFAPRRKIGNPSSCCLVSFTFMYLTYVS